MLVAACGARVELPGPAAPSVYSFATDTNRVDVVAPGVTHRFIYSQTGPWAIHVLDVDLAQCYTAIAVKGSDGAAGRMKTSTMLANLRATENVVGGVNGDFFSLVTGAPIGALISRGRVITGPYTQPVLAFDSAGAAHVIVLRATGTVMLGGRSNEFHSWNRTAATGLAWYDAAWGRTMDTATSAVEVVLDGRDPSRVVAIDTTRAGVPIPAGGGVLIAGRAADPALRAALVAFRPGDTLRVTVSLAPFHPREAVGGRPMLVRDSVVVGEVDTEGQPSFRLRNPRTAAGIARDGKRLILVVVDGRQKGYSDGMTLRETANLLLALGARDAINLDGGGSSTLVYADPAAPGGLRVADRPSDPTGERPVGDALGIVKGCGGR
jgi:hypothetical protein